MTDLKQKSQWQLTQKDVAEKLTLFLPNLEQGISDTYKSLKSEFALETYNDMELANHYITKVFGMILNLNSLKHVLGEELSSKVETTVSNKTNEMKKGEFNDRRVTEILNSLVPNLEEGIINTKKSLVEEFDLKAKSLDLMEYYLIRILSLKVDFYKPMR